MRGIALQTWVIVSLAIATLGQAPQFVWTGPAQLQQRSSGAVWAGPLDALAVATGPTGSAVVWAGGDGGLFQFNPSLGTWTATTVAQPVTAVAVSSGGGIFAGTAGGLLYNGGQGNSWISVGGPLGAMAIRAVIEDPGDVQHSLVIAAPPQGASGQAGLYGSSDGGQTWQLLLPGDFDALAWQGSSLLVAGPAGVECSSANAAAGSFQLVLGVPSGITHAAVAAAPGGGFYALLAPDGAAPSFWQISSSGAAAQVSTPASLSAQNGLALGVDTSGNIFAAGGSLLLSRDGGQTWTAVAAVGPQPRALAADGLAGMLAAGADGLWLASATGSAQDLNQGLANAAPIGFVLTSSGVLTSLDSGHMALGGATTQSVWALTPAPGRLTDLVTGPGAAFTALGSGQLWQASDGLSWTQVTAAAALQGTPTALASSPAGLWIGTSTGQVVGPEGASQVSTGAITALAVAGSLVWAASTSTLYASNDGGVDWTDHAAPGAALALAADAQQPGLLALADAGGVQWSLDGGLSWSAPVAPGEGAPVTALAFDPAQTLWVATLGRGLWSADFSTATDFVSAAAPPASVVAGGPLQLTASLESLGAPVAGAELTFAMSEGGQALPVLSATTDVNGVADVTITPTKTGTIQVLIAAPQQPNAKPAQISFTVAAAPAQTLRLISDQPSAELIGTTVTLQFEAEDSFNNPVPGATITLSGGTFSNSHPVTDSAGQAQTQLTWPSTPGGSTLTAQTGTVQFQWSISAFQDADFQLTLTPPSQPIAPGNAAQVQVGITPRNGFNLPVSLACTAPQPGCSMAAASISPGSTTVATVDPNVGGNQASLTLSVTGTVGGVQHIQTVSLPLQAFSLDAATQVLQVRAGAGEASLPMTLTAQNGFAGSVGFTVTLAGGGALPSSLAPGFRPVAVQLAGSTQSVEFDVAAASSSTVWPLAPPRGAGRWWLLLGVLVALALWQRRHGRWAAVALLGCALAGCGGGGAVIAPPPPPPPQVSTYSMQITAQSGSLTASIPLQLTVTSP